MDWTSTKDSTPEEDGFFLIYDIGWDSQEYMMVVEFEYGAGDWFDGDGNEYKPTHWMPLPQEPKQND